MLCENCQKRPATTHITRTVNGKTTQLNLCAHCAAEQGFHSAFGFDLNDFWGSLFSEPTLATSENAVRCPDCGHSFKEIAEQGRPGCPTCYRTFYDRLLPSIQRIHGKTQHTGKVAENAEDTVKRERELQALREELNQHITNQEYEKCAALRDRIRELEGNV